MSTELSVRRVAAADDAAHAAVLEVMRRGFFPHEAVVTAFGVARSPRAEQELLDLVSVTLKDGVSVAAYLGDTMVCAAVNKIQVRPPAGELSFFQRFTKERVTEQAAKRMMDFMVNIDSKADLFGEAGGEPLLEIMFLGAIPEAGRRGAGFAVCDESVTVARELGAKGACAIWTSDYSAAIGRRLGFQVLSVTQLSELFIDGRPLNENLPPHQQQAQLALLKLGQG